MTQLITDRNAHCQVDELHIAELQEIKVAEHSFQVPMSNSPLLLKYL